ncbi:unnamed protein product, partial [Rotaria magnacalcarata]
MSNTNRYPNRQSTESTNGLASSKRSPGAQGGDIDNERTASSSSSSPPKSDSNSFIGKDELLVYFKRQLKYFEEWHLKQDWLAFHNHHYDWWMFPIDEISSRDATFQLPRDVILDLKENREFISDLRRGVYLMVSSWGWDIEHGRCFEKLDDKQKWSYWPVRLYKAGKCMWLFEQMDYYQSLKKLAYYIKDERKEKLDFFSHTKKAKANVIEQWNEMER